VFFSVVTDVVKQRLHSCETSSCLLLIVVFIEGCWTAYRGYFILSRSSDLTHCFYAPVLMSCVMAWEHLWRVLIHCLTCIVLHQVFT